MKALLTLILCAVVAPTGLGAAWSGTETTEDGVLHVHNPAAPAELAQTLALTELWRRGGEDDDVMFGVTGRVIMDAAGNTYVLDRQLSEIQIFDPSGQWLRTIGRQGEGPGEFQNAADLFFTPGGNLGVSQMFPGKVVQLAPDGTPLDNFPLRATEGFMALQRGRALGDRLAVAGSVSGFDQSAGAMTRESFLATLDEEGNELVRFHESTSKVDFATLRFLETDLDGFTRNWTVTSDGRVVASLEWDAYQLTSWNPDGTVDRVIHRTYTATKRSDEEKERAKRNFGININGRDAEIQVADVKRCVQTLYPRPDGTLWVLSDRGETEAPDDMLATLDVFDPSGRFITQVHLPAEGDLEKDGLFIHGDRVYVIRGFADAARTLGPADAEEEEDLDDVEPLTVVCYQIDGKS